HLRREVAKPASHLHARLDEPKDVVYVKPHVEALGVTDVLGDDERGVCAPEPRPRRLVHLTDNELLLVEHVVGPHVAYELLRLSGPLADPAERANAAMPYRHVVYQLRDQDRLAYARATDPACLAAALQWR